MHYFESGGHLPDATDVVHVDDDYWGALVQDVLEAGDKGSLPGPGSIDIMEGTVTVAGHDTEFRADDERRELLVGGQRTVIARVLAPDQIELQSAYQGTTVVGAPYSIGAKLISSPWTVRLPTALVTLDPDTLDAG